MQHNQVKTHDDGIWISATKERAIIRTCMQAVLDRGYQIITQNDNNHGYPYVYGKNQSRLDCRFVDSVFLESPQAWHESAVVVTDNHVLQPVSGKILSVIPEFWHIWRFDPRFEDREPTWAFNCFMNRPRGDRSLVWYELNRRGLLQSGLVSFNVDAEAYQQQFEQASLHDYAQEHQLCQPMIPYNNLSGTLEQCIIDSKVSVVLETYTSDNHIVFSEKIFRCLQMPRPWLLYCSPGAVALLKTHGFDVLDDVVNTDYDTILSHSTRLRHILDQLEHFTNKRYTPAEYDRFRRASAHNQQRLQALESQWPNKLHHVLEEIGRL